jgi:hypothetical protein
VRKLGNADKIVAGIDVGKLPARKPRRRWG